VISDNPIEGVADDLLSRESVAESIADNIRSVDASKGYVVGVLGPWGSGKTSLVNLIRERLEDIPSIPVLDFNPWMFSGTEQLVESFFAEMAAQLRLKGGKFEGIANGLDAYSELLTPLTLLPFVGAWFDRFRGATGSIKRFQEKRKEGVATRRARLISALDKLDVPIVVVIDDIDRLTTAEIREMFKLVRLTASFANIIYLLAFDRARVERALSEDGIVGRDYLEKIVQTAIDIPDLPEHLLLTTLGDALGEAVGRAAPDNKFDEGRWPDVLMEVIWPLVNNMRDVRRYAASIYATLRTIRDQIELVDILGLEAVRIFMPDTFKAISRAQLALTSTSAPAYGGATDDAMKLAVEDVVAAATAEASRAVGEAIIHRTFPAGERYISNNHHGPEWSKIWLRQRRVANGDVLKLYLEKVANTGFSAFTDAESILSVAADPAALKAAFAAIDPDRLEDVVAALEAYEGAFPADTIAPLTAALFAILPIIPDRERPFMSFADARLVVTRVALRALRQLASPEQVEEAVTSALEHTSSLSAKLALIQMVGHTEGAGHKLVSEDVAATYEASFRSEVAAATPEHLVSETDLLRVLFAAAAFGLDAPHHLATVLTPELTRVILLDAVSETRSRPVGNRAVTRRPRLSWDLLLELFGSPEALTVAIDASRALAEGDEEYAMVLNLADRYAAGWRPPDFGHDDEGQQSV
jgi:energy-coupling factor transporter ATP-binding protein EcfA2